MSDEIQLTSPDLRVVINPQRGNIITSLETRNKQWMYIDKQNYESDERPRCGCPVLFPYMGSLMNDQLVINKQIYPSCIHGIVHTNHWQVIEQTHHKAVVRCEATKETLACFPYAFTLETTMTVTKKTVLYHLRIHNTSNAFMPCDIGFHPFFQISQLKDVLIIIDDEKLVWTDALYETITTSGQLFTNVKQVVCKEGNNMLTLKMDTNLPNLFLWSGKPEQFIVIEPWTSYVNAINEGKQYFTIEPNGYRDVQWRLCVDEIIN